MKNYERVYNQIMRGMIKENLDGDESPRYEVYKGPPKNLIYIADLDQAVNDLQQRIMRGDHCELKHAIVRKKVVYLLDGPVTGRTDPVFVLS